MLEVVQGGRGWPATITTLNPCQHGWEGAGERRAGGDGWEGAGGLVRRGAWGRKEVGDEEEVGVLLEAWRGLHQ